MRIASKFMRNMILWQGSVYKEGRHYMVRLLKFTGKGVSKPYHLIGKAVQTGKCTDKTFSKLPFKEEDARTLTRDYLVLTTGEDSHVKEIDMVLPAAFNTTPDHLFVEKTYEDQGEGYHFLKRWLLHEKFATELWQRVGADHSSCFRVILTHEGRSLKI